MSRLNIAVIGAGYWGKKVIAQILDIARTGDAINLYSVADSSPTALEQCRKEFGPLNYRLDYRELLSDPKVSAVHLCSPNQTHFGIASEFLRQGKHVLVEKPLAMKSKETYELVRLAREHGSVLCTGHVHRFNNGVRGLQRLMASRVLGDIYYFRLKWTGFMAIQNNTLREEILHFARCIEYNSSTENYPNRADGTLGANVVRVLETTKKSLEDERTIQVEIPRGEPIPVGEPIPGMHASPPSMGSI